MCVLPQKATPPTTPLPERAPWALVIGGEPFSVELDELYKAAKATQQCHYTRAMICSQERHRKKCLP